MEKEGKKEESHSVISLNLYDDHQVLPSKLPQEQRAVTGGDEVYMLVEAKKPHRLRGISE